MDDRWVKRGAGYLFVLGAKFSTIADRQPRRLILLLLCVPGMECGPPFFLPLFHSNGNRHTWSASRIPMQGTSSRLQTSFPFWSAASASRAAAVKVRDVSSSDSCHEWPRNQNGSQRTQVRPWKQQGAGLAGLASGVPHLEALVFETLGPIKEELNPPFFQVRGTKPRKQFRGRLRKLVVESLGSARPRGERAPCLPWLAGIGLGLGSLA